MHLFLSSRVREGVVRASGWAGVKQKVGRGWVIRSATVRKKEKVKYNFLVFWCREGERVRASRESVQSVLFL